MAIALFACAATYPQKNSAQEARFTAANLLMWEQSRQDGYFEVSISMAAVLTSQNRSQQAICINDWYFAPTVDRSDRNNEIRGAMDRFQNFHPMLVVLAVIEKACGELVFK